MRAIIVLLCMVFFISCSAMSERLDAVVGQGLQENNITTPFYHQEVLSLPTGPSNHLNNGAVYIKTNGETCFRAEKAKKIFLYDSGSMEPTLNTYSEIVYVPARKDNVRVGDIIVFQSEEYHGIVLHRVVNVSFFGREFITKGDNNNAPDNELVSLNNVLGVVVGVVY